MPNIPASRSRRQVLRCELYSPSRRSSAPITPGLVHRLASSSTESLYAALNCRRLADARTSVSGAARDRIYPLATSSSSIFICSRAIGIRQASLPIIAITGTL